MEKIPEYYSMGGTPLWIDESHPKNKHAKPGAKALVDKNGNFFGYTDGTKVMTYILKNRKHPLFSRPDYFTTGAKKPLWIDHNEQDSRTKSEGSYILVDEKDHMWGYSSSKYVMKNEE